MKRPYNINIIRNNNSNKIHYSGGKKDDNINYSNGINVYEYIEEEEKINNYIDEDNIKET